MYCRFYIFLLVSAYFTWGLLLSVPPVIYPPEAEKRGLLPSQYGFSFGIVDLTALLSSPFFATYGETIGPKLLYTAGGFIQGVSGLAKACMAYVDNSYAFLTISYVAGWEFAAKVSWRFFDVVRSLQLTYAATDLNYPT